MFPSQVGFAWYGICANSIRTAIDFVDANMLELQLAFSEPPTDL